MTPRHTRTVLCAVSLFLGSLHADDLHPQTIRHGLQDGSKASSIAPALNGHVLSKNDTAKKDSARLDSLRVLAHFDALDGDARAAFGDSITTHKKQGGPFHYLYTLYLLPSGQLAFPFEETLTERDRVEFSIMKTPGLPVGVKILGCGQTAFDRVFQATAADSPKSPNPSAIAGLPPVSKYRLTKLSTVSRCADSIRFEVTVTDVSGETALISRTATTLYSDRTYLYAAGGGYGYDNGRPTRWTIDSRPDKTGDASEKFLQESGNATGPGAFLSLGFRPCGLNPREVRIAGISSRDSWHTAWLCFLVSPTFVLPTTRTLNGLSVALPIFSAFGTEILAGASVAQIETLKKNVNASIVDTAKYVGSGRAYTLPGDLPVDRRWDRRGIGWFIGLSTSIAAVQAFFNPAEGSGKKVSATQQGEAKEAPGAQKK